MRAKRRFGQNFLEAQSVITAIIAAISPRSGDNIIEIGPGKGALTEPLLSSGTCLTAVEIDRDCAALLRKKFGEKLSLRVNDVLREDFSELLADGTRLVGNLPYNISTPFLVKMSDSGKSVKDAHLMLQKEVGERLCAPVGGKNYGRLSVTIRRCFSIEMLFEVPPSAFSPIPQVNSIFVKLTPLKNPVPWSPTAEKILRAAFQSRRKTLANALKCFLIDWPMIAIDGTCRAENLSAEEFSSIARYIDNK